MSSTIAVESGAAPPMSGTTLPQTLAEHGWLPDAVVRFGIRRLLRTRLADEYAGSETDLRLRQEAFRRSLATGPIAVATDRANAQHYEVPAEFFREVLGARRKYSSGYWPSGVSTLSEAEEAMLDLTCRRAGIEDGMDVLDLGCGWGALSLWIAERHPGCRVLALSNSHRQRASIEADARARGLENLCVETADINAFSTDLRFDRVVSVEMFEHMRNWEALLARVALWLRPEGRALVHTFCHREVAYPYETDRDDDWMGRFFFTGGIMPAADTILRFDRDLVPEEQWCVDGTHYERTARAWLENLDRRRDAILPVLDACYGAGQGALWHGRWRLFFLACAELFGFRGGSEWFVVHTRLRPRER